VLAAEFAAERREPLDPLTHAVQGLAPEQLDVGLGRGDVLGGWGRAAEVKLGMEAAAARLDPGRDRRAGDTEVARAEISSVQVGVATGFGGSRASWLLRGGLFAAA
jgi:hypothetical protein